MSSQSSPLRVALAQIAPALGDLPRNVAKHSEALTQARAQQADLILFPELSLTGYYLRDMVPDVARKIDGAEFTELIAAAGDAAFAFGFVEESAGHKFYNAAAWIEDGRVLHVHRKVYLPTYGLFDEQRYFAEGERFEAFDSPRLGRVGLLICEDFWHLSALSILQAEEVDVVICLSNSPARGVATERVATSRTYETLARAYAQLLGAAVIFVNRAGFEDGICFWGGSMVVGPDGEVVAQAPFFDEALTIAPFDRAELRRQRILTPLGRDERLLVTLAELDRIKRRRYAD